MRIAFLTQDDPLYILPFFQSFFAQAGSEIEVAGVYACRSMGKRKRRQLFGELLRLYRPGGFLKLLALQAAKRAQGLLGLKSHASMRQVCALHCVPYARIGDPNQPEMREALSALRVDVLVSIACPYILKEGVLSLPAQTSINLHHAPLPRYKGMMPTFWQMYHGERSVGLTVHIVARKVDEGPILYQDSLPIVPGESMHELIQRSKRSGAAAVLRVLQQLGEGTTQPLSSMQEKGSYFTFPSQSEMAEFHRRKLRVI